jgi:hypothetical protein
VRLLLERQRSDKLPAPREAKRGAAMAINQSPLGQHIQEQMQEIENDSDIPDDAQVGRIVTIVEIIGPEGKEDEFTNVRVRANARPYVAVGLLEVAKRIQLKSMGI